MSTHIHTEAIQIAMIKAQRIEVKPMIALATEESIRAYTIWHSFTFGGKEVQFRSNRDPTGMKLSAIIMEPVLSTFNLRFADDTNKIKTKIGSAWSSLDQYKPSLWDKSIPGDLILMCALDTIIIMTHALTHQQIAGKGKTATDHARALTEADIDNACLWYTAPKQNIQTETHARIRTLLAPDFSPIDKSLANLQMKVIETVELQSVMAAAAMSIFGRVVKNVWDGKGIFS